MTPAETAAVPVPQDQEADPGVLVQQTQQATAILRDTFRVARATLRAVADHVDREVTALLGEARGDRRILVRRAGDAEGLFLRLRDAIEAGRRQLGANATAIADIRQQLAAAETSSLVRHVEALAGVRKRLMDLITPGTELEAALGEAQPYLAAFNAAVTRRVHAAALAERALFVGEVGARLQRLRAEYAQAMALKTTADSQDQALQQLVERAAARSGTALPVPTIVWPSGRRDPFDGPVLKTDAM